MNNNNYPIYDLSNMEDALIRSRLWDAQQALEDRRYMCRPTGDIWAKIMQLLDALEALQPEPETVYLTRDQMASMLGNDSYIHVNDFEDLAAVSYSIHHPKPVGFFIR